MKQTIAGLLLMIFHTAQAQTAESEVMPIVRVAGKAGYLHTTLRGADAGEMARDGNRISGGGWMAGVSVENPINNRFGFVHELFYQQSSLHYDTVAEGNNAEANLTLHSIRLSPASFAYHVGTVQFAAGPYVSMLTASTLKMTDENGRTYYVDDPFGTKDDAQYDGQYLQKMDYGLIVGAEYRAAFGVLFGVQFSRGFASLFDNSNSYEADSSGMRKTPKIYRQQLSLFAGYRF